MCQVTANLGSFGQDPQQEPQLIVNLVAVGHRLADLGTQRIAEAAAGAMQGRTMGGLTGVPLVGVLPVAVPRHPKSVADTTR